MSLEKEAFKVFPVRMPEKLHKQAKIKAIQNGESLHGMILRLLRQEVDGE